MILPAIILGTMFGMPTVQAVDTKDDVTHSIGLATGFDNAVAPATLSYAVRLTWLSRPLILGGAISSPMLRPGLDDFAAGIHAEIDLSRNHLMLRAAHGSSYISNRNDAFSARGVAVGFGATVGWTNQRFAIGLETNVGATLFTTLSTTQWARTFGGLTFERGTLLLPAYNLEVGLRAATVIGRYELSLRFGYDAKGQYNIAIPPVYATVGVAVRWGQ
jgi:hypothetical protein